MNDHEGAGVVPGRYAGEAIRLHGGPTPQAVAYEGERLHADVLAGRICAAAADAARAQYILLELLGEFDAVGGIKHWSGFKSLAHWLSWACAMTPGRAGGQRSIGSPSQEPSLKVHIGCALGEAQRVCGIGSALGPRPRSGPGRARTRYLPDEKGNSANEDRCLCKARPFPRFPRVGAPRRRNQSGGGAAGSPDRPASRRCKMASTAESLAPCRRPCWGRGLNLGEVDDGACCRDRGCGQARAGLRR